MTTHSGKLMKRLIPVRWSPTIQDTTNKYFFIRVWNAGGGDAPGADPAKPIAWLAPMWTGR